MSCASADERSWLIVGMQAQGVELRPLPAPKQLILWNFRGISGAGVVVYNVSNGLWALRSARAPPARPLGVGAAFNSVPFCDLSSRGCFLPVFWLGAGPASPREWRSSSSSSSTLLSYLLASAQVRVPSSSSFLPSSFLLGLDRDRRDQARRKKKVGRKN